MEVNNRGARVSLKVEAGAPVILIPRSSKSHEVLVGNLGNLTLSNKFLFSGSPGTIAASMQSSKVDEFVSYAGKTS